MQIGAEPLLHIPQLHSFALMVINYLIAIELADGEVFRFRVGEVKAAYACAGPHGAALSQVNSSILLDVEKVPENPFFSMVGAGGITRRRPDTAIFFANQIVVGEIFCF